MEWTLAYRSYRRTLRAPLRTAHGWWRERTGLLVRLAAMDGAVGFGEVAPLPEFGTETLAEAEAVCRTLTGRVTAGALDSVDPKLGCVRFALAMAREAPGTAAQPPADARRPVTALLPAGAAALGVLPERLAEGFLSFKWKVGVAAVDEELGLLDDILAALPPYARLRLDANGAWARRPAERWLAACAERPVEFVEQPVPPGERDLLFGLARDFPVKLALDEAVTGLAAARAWQAEGWTGVFVIKPALAGPLAEVADWVRATQADVVWSSAVESCVARAAILRTVLAPDLGTRALGFGLGALFGERAWDGPAVGPLLDASWGAGVAAEELWNALS